MSSRRPLRFKSITDIPLDVDVLLAAHITVGRWSLAQICNHLTFTIEGSLDGFPLRTAPRIVQLTFGQLAIASMLLTGRIARNFPLPKRYCPAPELDLATEAARLAAAVDRYTRHAGPLAPHPFIGRMSRRRYDRYHCIHCAHHLSFAVPLPASSPIDTTASP
jgi:hypothetical protein